ncbi:MAG: SusC/RagA family TonB-linked outer membrane protein [Bacteroidota bacterium]|nr:SusC/RagA family TonB-linked outer membrane protein [Bacteroidota bacterium]
MRKLAYKLTLFLICGVQMVFAQKVVTGKVTDANDGTSLPGVNVAIKGTNLGITTGVNGEYSLKIPKTSKTLVFSFVGYDKQEIALGNSSVVNVQLKASSIALSEVVVTALGITRDKKSLGYASQEVKGENIAAVRTNNFVNNLSGLVSGVQVKKNTNMGGSTNVVMRGNKSLTGDNQVLYVVDGVPINNNIGSAGTQNQGAVGYDYGNAASDINPDDIESINVLKGSAATALYGSRASGGVIMITTKKGSSKSKGIGVTLSSNLTYSSIDKSTFPTYQTKYGAGYGECYGPNGNAWFESRNSTGGSTGTMYDWVPTTEDASYGAKYDGHPVYGWYSVDPQSPWYGQTKPWTAAKNGPITFFNHPVSTTNTVSIDNSTDNGSVRLSYTNYNSNGLMPNSSLKKDNVSVNGSWKVTDKLTATASSNYTHQSAIGRNSTGYNDNILTSMRQWMETNTDYQDLKTIYDITKRNISWNYGPYLKGAPIFWDNPYFTRYQNYEDDGRNRFIGNVSLDYKITDWLSAFGRVSADSYNEYQEERRAIGSVPTTFGLGTPTPTVGSGYLKRDITFSEYNYDFMLNINKNFGKDISLKGILGATERRTNYSTTTNSTNGGLAVPELYSIQNSLGRLLFPVEYNSIIGVRGLYASASLSYKSKYFLDATFRQDYASTLPVKNSTYYYPSITGSYIFSESFKPSWLSFGKVRLNYAEVGNLAGFDQLNDKYVVGAPFNSALYTLSDTKNNPNLKPESTQSYEAGLEMKFLKNRIGFDLALYNTYSKDQIMPVTLSQTTGYHYMYVNAGEIQNKGVELTVNLVPVQTSDFKWSMDVNFAKNQNKVISLYPGISNLQLGSFQGNVTLNATVGQPYGVLKGTDYTYDAKGNKIIGAEDGLPIPSTTADKVIGNVNPDWTGGIHNTFTYQDFTLSFLIDIQKGGDIYSLDTYYGMATGLYPETAGVNDLGNPVRDPVIGDPTAGYDAKSGGYIIKGVNVINGVSSPNKTRVDATSYAGWGYMVEPNKAFIYDAGYVKLREVSLSYNIPSSLYKKSGIKGIVVSAVGSNLWIISKHLPYADPESGLAAGNVQGYSLGSLPSTRDFGFNIKLNF